MRLEFIGAAHEVTGSCHFLQIGDKRVLVDCGMEQGADIYENQEIPVKASDIDYVLVTHAHIDHSGLLPLLVAHGFSGNIYCTRATMQLCNVMLHDSAHIQEQEAEWKNRKAKRADSPQVVPLYTIEDVERTMRLFIPCSYGERIEVCDEIRITFRDAGHLLGSSFIEIEAKEGTEEKLIVFSGDLGNGNRVIIRDPEIPERADYLVIESTYGDRLHEVPPDYAEALSRVIAKTFARGGNVVIPAFSVGRTQELLYYLRRIKEEKLLPEFPGFDVYIDSPMAIEATTVFDNNEEECFRPEALAVLGKGVNPIMFDGLHKAVTSDDSRAINFLKKPAVIISASGMCEAGRIRHHLKYNLWRPECTVIFVGYQCPGTLGAKLLDGADEVKLFGEEIAVRAEILNLPGISGHADKDHLTAWVQGIKTKPKKIFVVHGEDKVTDGFAEHLTEVTGISAAAPYSGDCYDLLQGEWAFRAEVQPVKKKETAKSEKNKGKTSSAYERLLAAGDRLLAVIHKNKEGANRDLGKFADQIIALCDKWDRK